MELNLTQDIDHKLSEISSLAGINKKDIIERALLFYIDTIQKQIELKNEFLEWDKLSDEAFFNFEKAL